LTFSVNSVKRLRSDLSHTPLYKLSYYITNEKAANETPGQLRQYVSGMASLMLDRTFETFSAKLVCYEVGLYYQINDFYC